MGGEQEQDTVPPLKLVTVRIGSWQVYDQLHRKCVQVRVLTTASSGDKAVCDVPRTKLGCIFRLQQHLHSQWLSSDPLFNTKLLIMSLPCTGTRQLSGGGEGSAVTNIGCSDSTTGSVHLLPPTKVWAPLLIV